MDNTRGKKPDKRKTGQAYSGNLGRNSSFGTGILTGNQDARFGKDDDGGGVSLCISLCTCCSSCGSGGAARMKKIS
ncbi:Protein of unknown function [Bacillus cereus]|uniref:Uncharacterized protein n=1 Tax=Bacillus wiedmannii TaxID=1890302 RepID=A0A2A7BUN9_9BACI|nr:hypothetical protein [Bacillus wiedmannii]KMP77634.1 hypothetical protein TU62_04175 [Bacillus cereus]MBG9855634.1 hypothetical protein [Bacillus wiedmannii]MCQ6544444.1 hypothetical protein [Bacillus wiedmannii]MCQ6573884.1 hypothetical protein [Bacillus wiedmannii]MCU5574604.1 hypothetical protein [Bacillus wiedmannii]